MVQKQVFRDQERCIYRIQESNMDFYMIIPSQNTFNLVLGLVNGIDDNKILGISKMSDKVIVIPVLDEKIFIGIQQNQGAFFSYLDKYFSNLINLSHKILTHNQLKLLDIIYFYSNIEYKNFRDWFIQKYQGRVQAIEIPLVSVQSMGVSEVVAPSPPQQVSSFLEQNASVESSQNNKPISVKEDVVSEEIGVTSTKEPGFVSYVLLGVIVAVLSLVFLYFIL